VYTGKNIDAGFRFGGHKTIQNNRALEGASKRAGITDVSSYNLRKTFATRLLSRGAAITDVQHLLGHASVETAKTINHWLLMTVKPAG